MITLREADWACDREILLGIRYAVFVKEQGVPPELEEDEQDAHARHLLAIAANGTPVGTARLLPDGQIGRMAVHREWRGKGVGSALLHALLETARQQGLSRVFLYAQCTAVPFYERTGFHAEGPVFDDAGIPHRRMSRVLD